MNHKQTKSFENTTKDKLVRLLRRLDLTATFPRFFDLPLELREQIYGHFLEMSRGTVSLEELEPYLRRVSPQFHIEASAVANRASYDLTARCRLTVRPRYSHMICALFSPTLAPDPFMGAWEEKPQPIEDDIRSQAERDSQLSWYGGMVGGYNDIDAQMSQERRFERMLLREETTVGGFAFERACSFGCDELWEGMEDMEAEEIRVFGRMRRHVVGWWGH